jgi:hypothetical protein
MRKENRRIGTRRSLFKDLNAKLKELDPSIADDIVCPLCWSRFSIDSLHSNLTIEHVPPRETAKLIAENCLKTLTCKVCNNSFGSQCQNDLKFFVAHQLLYIGKYDGAIPSKITLPGAPAVRCNVFWTSEKVMITVVPKANDPKSIDKQLSKMKEIADSGIDGWKIGLSGNFGYTQVKAWSASLQIAYLLAYIFTDCEYGFQKGAVEIRRLLNQGNTAELGPCIIRPQLLGVGGDPWMAIISQPKDLRCLWIKAAGIITILPLPDDSALSCYTAWQNVCDKTHFGLTPKEKSGLHLSLEFQSKEHLLEAAKCMPGLFAGLTRTSL